MNTKWLARRLPRSLAARVFALYSLALTVFVVVAVALFCRYQFGRELETELSRGDALLGVIAPAIAENAVIGDYDSIQRTLERAIEQSSFAYAAFIDIKGGVVKAVRRNPPELAPPDWLAAKVGAQLYDTNLPLVIGGRDYGVLRLSYAADQIAGELWRHGRWVLVIAIGGLAFGLLLIWLPLKHWLGNLGRLQVIGEGMGSGALPSAGPLSEYAPIEFQRTFEALNRAAAAMQAQREQAAVTLSAIADGVFTLDDQGRILLANPAACEMSATPPEVMRGRPAHVVMPDLFKEHAGYAPWCGRRVRLLARDGSARVLDTTLSSITDAEGRVHGHVLACRDVSEQHALDLRLQDELRTRRTAQTALRGLLEGLVPQTAGRRGESADDIEAVSTMIAQLVLRMQEHSDQLRAIFALSPDGFVSFDARRMVNYVSPAFARLTGLDDSQVLGLEEREFARVLTAQCLGPQAEFPPLSALEDLEDQRQERRRRFVEIERPQRRTLELALRTGDGDAISQVLLLRDVTLESKVDQMKSEFLSTAAHELRTPMTSIYGFSELMMHRKLSAERQQEVISTIYRQTGRMIAIVNELLDLARIEARRGTDFVLEDIDLRLLVTEVVRDFKPPHERDGPSLTLPAHASTVKVDASKFVQALSNVLSNAYKYSPEGGTVRVSVASDTATSRIALRVQDEGIGMTPDQLNRVCERFYRADASGSIPGTGLGMSIVKEIVELLGGSLELVSSPGIGTEVTIWLPCTHATMDAATEGALHAT